MRAEYMYHFLYYGARYADWMGGCAAIALIGQVSHYVGLASDPYINCITRAQFIYGKQGPLFLVARFSTVGKFHFVTYKIQVSRARVLENGPTVFTVST